MIPLENGLSSLQISLILRNKQEPKAYNASLSNPEKKESDFDGFTSKN